MPMKMCTKQLDIEWLWLKKIRKTNGKLMDISIFQFNVVVTLMRETKSDLESKRAFIQISGTLKAVKMNFIRFYRLQRRQIWL